MALFPRLDIDELETTDEELIYQITDWFIPEMDKTMSDYETSKEYSIYIYGTTRDNITICSKVINFRPYFYIKPPISWDGLSDKKFVNKLRELEEILMEGKYESKFSKDTRIIPKDYVSHLEKVEYVNKKDFWGFTNNKDFRFIKITFKSLYLYNKLKYYFQSPKVIKEGYKLYESNIDPFLRFIHLKNLRPCGWVKVSNYSLDDAPDTICNYNICVDWNEIEAVDINEIAPMIVASFDIECMSSHGDFPVAIKNYKKLAQDLCSIACVGLDDDRLLEYIYKAYFGDVVINEIYKIHRLYPLDKGLIDERIMDKLRLNEGSIRFILNKMKKLEVNEEEEEDEEMCGRKGMTNKECNEIEDALNKLLSGFLPKLEGDKIIQIGISVNKFGNDEIIYKKMITLDDCDMIEGIDLSCCKTEKELLMVFKRFMNKLNPDIIIGYNIWGFDIEYIWDRTKELGINDKFRLGLGRIRNRNVTLVEQKLSSSALGDNIFKLLELDGIVNIDLFKVIQKDFKLDSYKLDNVASIYIGDKKDDLKPKEIFERFKGNASDRAVIARYCMQDCILVNKLLHKLKIVENNIGMGNVCLVPLNYLFRRGQGIKIFSLISNECMKRGYLIPVMKHVISDDEVEGYEGAIVLDPKESIYLEEPIVVFDYGSLYPSSMICRNLSHDTFVMDKKYMDMNDNENVEFVKVAYDLYEGVGDKKVKTGVKECYYARYKDGSMQGIIPSILEMLLNERKNTRKRIEYMTVLKKDGSEMRGLVEEDKEDYMIINEIDKGIRSKIDKKEISEIRQTYNKFECAVFDALQNAYKITANSLYGQIGARTSPVYLKDIAACTTSTGREMIMIAKKFVEDNYDAEVIYGDTDSIFCKFNIYDKDGGRLYGKEALGNAIKIGEEVERRIKGILPYPQKLNYEKCMYPFILFSKKRYVGNLYEKDVNSFKQKSMGIVLKRRDNANIVKKIFGGVIDYILNKQDIELSIKFLREELNDLVEGRTDMKDLILSKTLRGFYKDPTKIAHKVLADRIAIRDIGNKPAVNDRIQYIYIKNPDGKLQGDKIETPEYIEEKNLEPDYLHYITNQIMKPVLQLYELCLEELGDYKESDDYWIRVEEELKKREMYKDDIRRRNRIESLRLLKVKEILFDEFINRLSEPKVRRVSSKKVDKKMEKKMDDKLEKTGDEWNGEIRIVESKVKGCITYKVIIRGSDGSEKWSEMGEEREKMGKDVIIRRILLDIGNKFEGIRMIIKINNKGFIKEYNKLRVKYMEIMGYDENKRGEDGMIMMINELAVNRDMIKIVNNIRLIE